MSKFNDGDLVRHVKTENVYRIVTSDALIEATLTPAYAYKGNHLPHVWIRPRDEMEDGRFVLVESALSHPEPAQAQVSDADSLAKVAEWLRAHGDESTASRLERLDAEIRESLDIANQRGDEWRRKFNEDTDTIAELRARLAACEKGFEVRCNEDGTLDEIVGTGTIHLEQMDTDHWWLGFGNGPLLHVNLTARGNIKASVMDERERTPTAPPDVPGGNG